MLKKYLKNKQAFSLIEAVVSITLVFVAFVAIMGSIIEIIKSENIVKNVRLEFDREETKETFLMVL